MSLLKKASAWFERNELGWALSQASASEFREIISQHEAELARLGDTLRDYRNAVRVCREAMSLVLMREKMWRELHDSDYTVIDGGSLTEALAFTEDLETANRSTIGMLRARIAELEEQDRQWDKHSLVQVVEERNRLRARDEAAKEMADFLRNLRYHHTNGLVRRWEEAGR